MRLLNVPRVSLPNLLTGKDVVIELLQHQAIPERLAREALGLLASNDARTSYLEAAQEVRLSLKGEGASKLAAEAVIEVIETGK
jgi:lipid-A-disaccharide synthase